MYRHTNASRWWSKKPKDRMATESGDTDGQSLWICGPKHAWDPLHKATLRGAQDRISPLVIADTKMPKERGVNAKNWCFTLNNYTEDELQSIISRCTKGRSWPKVTCNRKWRQNLRQTKSGPQSKICPLGVFLITLEPVIRQSWFTHVQTQMPVDDDWRNSKIGWQLRVEI